VLLAVATLTLLAQVGMPSPPPLPGDFADTGVSAPPLLEADPPPDVAPAGDASSAPPPPPLPVGTPRAQSPGPVVYAPDAPRKKEGLAPIHGAVLFAPMSLFGLYVTAEFEFALPAGLSSFVALGGGLFGQLGFEGGLRYAVLGTSIDGPFIEARGAGFFLPGQSYGMLGPGFGLGYTWRTRYIAASLGVGVTLWWSVWRTARSRAIGGMALTESFVLLFPGFFEPPPGRNAVQPTIRFAVGPWF
jgi:hypothetical protein